MERVRVPEILDELSAEDPRAVAARRDLRRINALMGNERWILRRVREAPEARAGIVELGSGGGELLARLARFGPATGIDLAPRPALLDEGIGWFRGDVFERLDAETGGVLVANLFLHHFSVEELRRLGALASGFRRLVVVEPWRARRALVLGRGMTPFVHPVTRHDMIASIRAGFVPGELGEALGLGPGWRISERCSWRGGLRVLASRE